MEKELSQTVTRFLYKEPRWQTAKRIRYKFREAKAFELFRILPLWEATVLLIVFSYDIIWIDNSFLVSGFRHYQPIQRLHRDMGHLVRCKANMWDSFRGCEAYSAGFSVPCPCVHICLWLGWQGNSMTDSEPATWGFNSVQCVCVGVV